MVYSMIYRKQLPRGVSQMRMGIMPELRAAADAEAAKYGVSTSYWINHVIAEAVDQEGPTLPEASPNDPPLAA